MQFQFDPHFEPPSPAKQLKAIGIDAGHRLNLTGLYRRMPSQRCFEETCRCCFDPANGEWEDIEEPMFGEWLYTMLHKTPDQDFAAYASSNPNRPELSRQTIYLLPLCEPSELEDPEYPIGTWPSWQFLQDAVVAFYSPLRTRVLPAVPLERLRPEVVSRPCQGWGRQFHASRILDAIDVPEDAYGVMAVAVRDLYPRDDWSFSYGLARLKRRVGVFSFVRHVPDPSDKHFSVPKLGEYADDPAERGALLLHRSVKTLLHELGHMFGMKHCTWYNCLMRGSNGEMVEHQWNPLHLCPVCLRKLHWNIGFDIVDRYSKLLALYQQYESSSHIFASECVFLRRRLQALANVAPGSTFCAELLVSPSREIPSDTVVQGATLKVLRSFVVDDKSRFHAEVGLTGIVLAIEESWVRVDFGRAASNWISPKKLAKLEVLKPPDCGRIEALATVECDGA